MLEDIRNTTDEAKSYTAWFEDEWKRNGVEDLVSHNKQLVTNIDTLLSLINKYKEALEEVAYSGPVEDFRDIAKTALEKE